MHDIAGLVALAIGGLWIAYLVPHRLRYRQQLLESRTEDRFSDALRVLVVTDPRGRQDARVECGPDRPKRSELLSPARGVPVAGRPAVTEREGGVVERPYGTQDKISADAARRQAQLRSGRAAAVARRAAAARRRAVLTLALLVVAAGAWVVVGVTSVAVTAAVVPTVLLAGVLALGRRAVVQGQAADAAWERQQQLGLPAAAARRARPASTRITGRALHPSDSHTEAVPQVTATRRAGAAGAAGATGGASAAGATPAADATRAITASVEAGPGGASGADRATSSAADDAPGSADDDGAPSAPADGTRTESWSPVPVPRPTYTTKATAPHREPMPLVVEDPATPAADHAPAAVDGEAVVTPPAIDLDAVLARRRAAGE